MVLEVAGVRLTAEIGLATILGDSEDGMTIPQIAERTSVDGDKLGSLTEIYTLVLSSYLRSSKSASFVSSLPRAGSVKQSRVTSPIIVSVILSERDSLDTTWLHTCRDLERYPLAQLNNAISQERSL